MKDKTKLILLLILAFAAFVTIVLKYRRENAKLEFVSENSIEDHMWAKHYLDRMREGV